MRRAPAGAAAIAPARLISAAVRLPFALFWGPRCLIRRTASSFLWGSPPPRARRCPPVHIYRMVCEPPCYGGCGCGCDHG
jgi:hypothetical protein